VDVEADVLVANSWVVAPGVVARARRRWPALRVLHRIDGSAADYGREGLADVRQALVNLLADATVFQSAYGRDVTRRRRIVLQDGPVIHNPVDVDRFRPDGPRVELPGRVRVAHVAFSTNPRKEISKNQKVFFWDTGIRNALLNTFAADELRPDLGAVWENWVIAEIAKRNVLLGSPCELFFWRSRSQAEVDLVVKAESGLRAFEIKWNPRRAGSAAFRSAYGVNVEPIGSDTPFVADLLNP